MRLERLNPGYVVLAGLPTIVTLSKATMDGKILILNSSTGNSLVLPKAVGSGATFRTYLSVASGSGGLTIKVNDNVDVMVGNLINVGTTTVGFASVSVAGADSIVCNRTVSGGALAGEWIELIDILPGIWSVTGVLHASGAPTTPFQALV